MDNLPFIFDRAVIIVIYQINEIGTWFIGYSLPIALTLAVAVCFLGAVFILFTRDMLRLFFILLISKLVTKKGVRVRTMNVGGSKRILIAGDSTAVGTGATRAEDTLMGMFAHDFPNVEIHNTGVNGAVTENIISQIETVQQIDFVFALISTGGNDVWRFTSLKKLEANLDKVLKLASALTDHKVILLLSSNIASAPIFPIFFREYMLYRAKKINLIFHEVADRNHIHCVDLFSQLEDNPFFKDPESFFARDGIHPNEKGYRLWYNRLWRILANDDYRLN